MYIYIYIYQRASLFGEAHLNPDGILHRQAKRARTGRVRRAVAGAAEPLPEARTQSAGQGAPGRGPQEGKAGGGRTGGIHLAVGQKSILYSKRKQQTEVPEPGKHIYIYIYMNI